MGKALGIIALVFGIVSLVFSPLSYLFYYFFPPLLIPLGLAVAGTICGAIGISKDDKAGLAIAGLILSSIALASYIIGFAI